MKVSLQGKDLVTVTNAYAPLPGADDEKAEQFYDDINNNNNNNNNKEKKKLQLILTQKQDHYGRF